LDGLGEVATSTYLEEGERFDEQQKRRGRDSNPTASEESE
jgi:hypothetical protein